MKYRIFLLCLLIPLPLWANMASPITEGSLGASPFISEYVDIVKENIHIRLDSAFQTAQFDIEYHIVAQDSGTQIPLLFYASEISGELTVQLDGQTIELQEIPDRYDSLANTPFQDFGYFFKPGYDSTMSFEMMEEEGRGFEIFMNQFRYFETDISKGEHLIQVQYPADAWEDRGTWIIEKSFRYALSPAKYWKSYSNLSITLDATACTLPLQSNLGEPPVGVIDSIASWNFGEMPLEVLEIIYLPEISNFTQSLIDFGPEKLFVVCSVIFFLLHLWWVWSWRKKNPERKWSWVAIVGAIVFPILLFTVPVLFTSLIDSLIGEGASGQRGYVYFFFITLVFPLVIPSYLMFMLFVDWMIKNRFFTRTN